MENNDRKNQIQIIQQQHPTESTESREPMITISDDLNTKKTRDQKRKHRDYLAQLLKDFEKQSKFARTERMKKQCEFNTLAEQIVQAKSSLQDLEARAKVTKEDWIGIKKRFKLMEKDWTAVRVEYATISHQLSQDEDQYGDDS